MAMPLLEQPLRLLQQVSLQLFRGGRSGVDQVLEVANQMGPAPLQPFQPPVHLGSVAADHARKRVGQQFIQHGGLARRSYAIDRDTPLDIGAMPPKSKPVLGDTQQTPSTDQQDFHKLGELTIDLFQDRRCPL